jgi:hypothetical protein
VEPAPALIDERELRGAQAVIAALLLGAFVFQVPLLVLALFVITAAGAVAGPGANALHAGFRTLIGPRLRPATETVAAQDARMLDIAAAVLLAIAGLAFLVGIDPLAWFFVLVEAAVATTEATTGYNAAVALLDRLRPRD